MRVLVTGAFGYVGHAVTRALLDARHEVVAMTTHPNRPRPATGVNLAVADLRDPGRLKAAVDGIDAVVHLAALIRVRESFDLPDTYAAVNTVGTRNLLAAVAGTGRLMPFVHASTAAVYGTPANQPVAEDCDPAPSSPYGATKLAADAAVSEAAAQGTIAGVSLRAFNIAGAVDRRPDPDLTRIIPKTLAVAAGQSDHLIVNGDGTAIRDYVHLADVADAFVKILTRAEPGTFAIYNIGATPASVAQIIDVARTVTGREIPVRHNPPTPEVPELRADTTRARTELGWSPVHSSLERIIGDSWDALR
ncbi:NAD-dependent epimerase/dehydratase family protein [Catenulispora rubra]|uniref:NAD-dependent epimerase/dehydratase family protein n=1 Tax=Catenulispora rubra TaxID=280293 RepID=UPI0018928647|nr:NAD-dependent epimerase/dehydratase family protein [Catenulispora rubra]